ncbi:MAG: Ig-like domain-containing protein [Clostridia bacterium]|nr:Ig-like domain-containing protein [Clostridia bacterium]
MKVSKRIIAVLLCMLILIPTASIIGSAAVFESKKIASSTSNTILDPNISRWAYTKKSYVYQDGENIVVIRIGENVSATTYNMNYQKLSEKNLEFELPVFGGFFSGEAFNYIAFGQSNTEESETKEVYRIVKYDKEFNKISHASIIGSQCHTITPFAHGSASMAESGKELTLHTARKRFTSDDGLNHQSQFTVVLDTTTMTPINNLKLFQDNHVSHSFNQFVQYDNGKRVLVDHGDAYPRSVVLSKYTGMSSYGYERYTEIDLFDIPGATGANCTGVNLGGFEVSENNYIVSINTVDHSKITEYTSFTMEGLEVDARDAVLLISAKDNTASSNVKKVYLTDYAAENLHATAPYLVKLTEKWFAAIWKEYKYTKKQSGSYTYYEYQSNGIKYVIVDENGNNLTDIKTASVTAELSDCQPIFIDNKVIWIYDNSSERNICTLDISDELEEISHVHTLIKVNAKASTCTLQGNNEYYKCSDCGKCYKNSSGSVATTADAEKLPLTAHQGGEATCTAKAACSVCGTPYGSMLPHTPGEWFEVSQPDCTNAGSKIKTCTVCNQTAETGIIPAKGHTPGDWIVTLKPTIYSNGRKARYCTYCSVKTDEQNIPKIGTLTAYDYATGVEIVYPENAYSGTVEISASNYNSSNLEQIISAHIGNCKYKAYSIGITVDGIPAANSGTFNIKLPVPAGINKDYAAVYILDTATSIPEKVNAKYENGCFVVENTTLGIYLIAEKTPTLSLSASSFELKPGESVQIFAQASERKVIYSSSNTSVATVDENGIITAHSAGTAVITATVEGSSVSETCTVTVTQNFFEMILSAILNAFTEFFKMLSGLIK